MTHFVHCRRRQLVVLALLAVGGYLLFPKGGQLPVADGSGQPPTKPLSAELAAAIRNGDLKEVRRQLDAGADVNASDSEGNTPLLLAALYAGADCVELLIKKGADVNVANTVGATALHRGATDAEKVRLLLAAGAKVNVRTKRENNTPLMIAAIKNGNSKAVEQLLDKGADVGVRNKMHISPIMAAAASGDLDTVKLLVRRGADVNDWPAGKDETFDFDLRTPLMWAALRNDVPTVRYLLEQQADPNKGNYYGTALSQAAWHDSVEAAELLLARGARVNVRDGWMGFTPLHWAAATDSPDPKLVRLLLKHGADPNAAGDDIDTLMTVPQTPRLLAERRGQTPIVAALTAAGATAPPRPAEVRRPFKAVLDPPDSARIRAAAERAVAALQASAEQSREYFKAHSKKLDCSSCHQQFLPMVAVGHARERAVRLDQQGARRQVELISKDMTVTLGEGLDIAERLFIPEQVHVFGLTGWGFAAEKVPPSSVTDTWANYFLVTQAADGRWHRELPRPPMQSGDVTGTANAVLVLRTYGWPGRKAEFDQAVDRARRWLWTVRAETTQDAVHQLLGLHWAGEPADKLRDLARALAGRQRKDGGWAQLPGLESDAYATGQVLYALTRAAGYSTSDRICQQGLRYLLATQYADGSWRVVRRAVPLQPTMKSGFPHQRDSWISAAGTCWAVMGMTQALEPGTTTEKPAPVATPPQPVIPVADRKVDFATEIKPVLERSCVSCHGPDRQRGGFRLDTRDALLKAGGSGEVAVVPGKSAQSPLIDYVAGRVEEREMPPIYNRGRFAALTRDEVELLRAWIEQGAIWPGDLTLTVPKVREP